MRGEERRLIKFSNYSLCVTLPKSVISRMKWKKGDVVQMFVDEKNKNITISKSKINKAKPKTKKVEKERKSQGENKARW